LELPKNGWSLLGLGRSLEAQNKPEGQKVLSEDFPAAWKDAETAIDSSCPAFSKL